MSGINKNVEKMNSKSKKIPKKSNKKRGNFFFWGYMDFFKICVSRVFSGLYGLGVIWTNRDSVSQVFSGLYGHGVIWTNSE